MRFNIWYSSAASVLPLGPNLLLVTGQDRLEYSVIYNTNTSTYERVRLERVNQTVAPMRDDLNVNPILTAPMAPWDEDEVLLCYTGRFDESYLLRMKLTRVIDGG